MPFIDWDAVPAREIIPGFHGQMIHTDRLTFARWFVEAGAALPEHAHPHEQITTVIEGAFEMTVDGETRTFGPGMVAVVPGDTRHAGRAITDCWLIDVFQPARDDYR